MGARWTTRRRLLTGLGTVALAAAALEYASFRGAFDFRRATGASARDRFLAGRATLESDAALAAGALVHVGHSTHLLSVAGARFLTDPWFNDPAFGALSHTVAPAVRPEEIGALDAVLVSHDHADHADP